MNKIKIYFLSFSLIFSLSNLHFFIRAQDVSEVKDLESKKKSIGKRVVDWLKTNPGKTLTIAVGTIAIGAGLFAYNYNEEEIAQSAAFLKPFPDDEALEKKLERFKSTLLFEEVAKPFYDKLSREDKEKADKEYSSLILNIDKKLSSKGLPTFTLIVSSPKDETSKLRKIILTSINKEIKEDFNKRVKGDLILKLKSYSTKNKEAAIKKEFFNRLMKTEKEVNAIVSKEYPTISQKNNGPAMHVIKDYYTLSEMASDIK